MAIFDRNVFNVVLLGVSFMFVFTAFQTGAMIQPRVLEAVKKNNTDFTGDGYTSLSIIYLVFAFANWISAPIVAVIGPRIAMFVGALVYTGFIASFLDPKTWSLYLMSTLLGLAAAVLWTAQGKYLTENSTKSTMARNSGVFWAIFQCSLLWGNLFVHFEFAGTSDISSHTRLVVYASLTGTGVFGTLLMILLRRPITSKEEVAINSVDGETVSPWRKMLKELAVAGRMILTKDMLLLSTAFFYTGIELTFFSGVYGTCITHTGQFGDDANSLIGYSGMLIGAGEIIGGLLFGILGSKTNKYGRDIIVLLGYVVHLVSFFLIFINLPDESPIKLVSTSTYIAPSSSVALLCSFLLGFADACYNTQVYSIIGVKYANESGSAFALFKFFQSLSAAIAFFYSDYLVMKWQLLILVISGFIGTWSFFFVEWSLSKGDVAEYTQISDD